MPKLFLAAVAAMALQSLAVLSSRAEGEGAPAAAPYASEVPSAIVKGDDSDTFLGEEGAALPIAQPVAFIVDQYLRQRGGYDGLKRIAGVDAYGTRLVGARNYPLRRHDAPPNLSRTTIKIGTSAEFESVRSNDGIRISGTPEGLGLAGERALLETFDFYGTVVDWDQKGYALKRLGVEKLPGVLAWKLRVDRPDRYRQVLYLDTRYGDVVKELVMDDHEVPIVEIARHDFRVVDGARFPFAVDYKGPAGDLRASDRLERIEVKREPR